MSQYANRARQPYQVWTPKERATVRDMAKAGASAREVAEVLGRSEGSVRAVAKRRRYRFAYTEEKRAIAVAAMRAAPRKAVPAYVVLAERRLRQRLTWQYGREKAKAILAGYDPATNRDLAAWKRLGQRKGEAA